MKTGVFLKPFFFIVYYIIIIISQGGINSVGIALAMVFLIVVIIFSYPFSELKTKPVVFPKRGQVDHILRVSLSKHLPLVI